MSVLGDAVGVGFLGGLWYPIRMRILVVTGGLGAGKSTAAKYFTSRGATALDLDDVAARLMGPGSPLLDRIAEEFGADEVLLADGRLDRPALARLAFASAEATRRLNSIVHPAVAGEVGPALHELDMLPIKPEVVVLEVPLLVEAPVFREIADEVLAIVAPQELRLARAVARGMGERDASRRLRVQATDAQRAEMADDVIINSGTEAEFLDSLRDYWDAHFAAEGVSER